MKYAKLFLIVAILAAMVLPIAACGGEKPTEPPPTQAAQAPANTVPPAPTNTPIPQPTDTPLPPPPTDTPPAEDTELEPGALAAATDLSSYRSRTIITAKGTREGQEVEESIDLTIEYTKDPLVQHILISATSLAEGETPGSIEMYRTADTVYMKMDEQWISTPATEENDLSEAMVTPNDLLEDTCGWKKEKNTEIKGIKVKHYTTTKSELEKCASTGLLAGVGEITDAGGDLYVAEDGSYVVQMDFFYEGTSLDFNLGGSDVPLQQGRLTIHLEMSDVNQSFSIQIPEEAIQAGALPEDIPIPADAEEVNNMFGMITFSSASTPQEIADFYKAEMPNNGWTEQSAEQMGDLFMLEYSKEARKASFMISTDSNTQKTSVMITVEEGE